MEQTVDEYFKLQKYYHMVKLIRWFGSKKNKGQYNKDAFFTILDNIILMKNDENELLKITEGRYPSKDILKKIANA